MKLFLIILFSYAIFFSQLAIAQSAAPAVKKQVLSFTAMALTSSTKQGGQGPSGSTILSQTEYVYGWPWYGVGIFFMYDQQGTNEKDSGYGPKLEFYLNPFYFETGYIMVAKRAYTDRTIAEQTGNGSYYGIGVRFNLSATGAANAPGWIFQASYKLRTLKITKQDDIDLSEPIEQQDGYPLIGIGYQF